MFLLQNDILYFIFRLSQFVRNGVGKLNLRRQKNELRT